MEEQALARIHRIGQEKEVTTIRFVMKESIEQVSGLYDVRSCLTHQLTIDPAVRTENPRRQKGLCQAFAVSATLICFQNVVTEIAST